MATGAAVLFTAMAAPAAMGAAATTAAPAVSGDFIIVNRADTSGCVTENNDAVYYQDSGSQCGINHVQDWVFPGSITNGVYTGTIKNVHFGWCLSVSGTASGVYAGPCGGNNAQNWHFTASTGSLVNAHTGYCVELLNGGLSQFQRCTNAVWQLGAGH